MPLLAAYARCFARLQLPTEIAENMVEDLCQNVTVAVLTMHQSR